MKFRTKIRISFFTITLVPIIIIIVLMTGIVCVQTKIVEHKYGIKGVGVYGMANQTKIYNKITEKTYNEIMDKVDTAPEEFNDEEFLDKLNEELSDKYSFIVMKKNDDFVYNGSDYDIDKIVDKYFEGKIPEDNRINDSTTYVYGNNKYIVKIINFASGENEYNIYIVTDIVKIIPQFKHMILEMIIGVIFVFVLTGGCFAFWIQKTVMKPLNQLTKATKRIAEGDLDFKLERTSKDEFGDLCEDFEYMRSRLKENAQERLRDDEENKELISNISHDLKTPMTAIKGYVEGIMDGVADTPEKMDKYIRTIYNKTNDMDRLIGELTMYSKIDTNRVPYNFVIVNVDDYFVDCVEEIAVDLEAHNIKLNYMNYVLKTVNIIADPEQLKRVINNIISNSVKYIGNKDGIVNIRINDEEDFIHVEIEDNGKGIAQKDIQYIFDRFYRTDASRNSKQGGSGIGLAIAKKIIEVHGGRIWATSKENIGTVIHFVIRKYYEQEVESVYEEDINS